MTLNRRQSLAISLLLCFFYLLPAINEWVRLGMPQDRVLLISAPIWFAFFYCGPFWAWYFLTKLPGLRELNLVMRGSLFVLLMFIGICTVEQLLKLAFPHFQLSGFDLFFSALLWGIFFFTLWEAFVLYQRYEREKQLRQQMHLMHLNNQLNPHFLFNSLNTVSAFIFHNPEQADDILHKFADILRYAVDMKDKLIDLNTELQISRFYMDIELARFDDKLQVNWQIDCGTKGVKVPPLLLQPLLENALQHSKQSPLNVDIHIYREQQELCIDIKDNGRGFSENVLKNGKCGAGIKLIKERLTLLNIGSLTLCNDAGAINQLRIKMPC